MTRLLLFAVFSSALLRVAPAMFEMPDLVPVDRLIKNAEKYVQAHPADAFAHYTLARIHYLAFVLKIGKVPAFAQADGDPPRPADDQFVGQPLAMARQQQAEELARADLGIAAEFSPASVTPAYLQAVSKHLKVLEKESWRPAEVRRDRLVEHAVAAAADFRKAIALDSKNALFPLGLGSLLEQFAEWTEDEKIEPLPAGLEGDLVAAARGHYLAAWTQAFPGDAKAKAVPIAGLSALVSFEAGRAFLRLAEEQSGRLSPAEKNAIPRVQAAIAKLEKLAPGAVTPIVLALRQTANLAELLASETVVDFDLRGFGAPERWPWLNAEAGLLVWDPDDRRTITSGRQLFGNYTFQIFCGNGYDALRLLDDDADGQLTGPELEGISVWFDRNRDGRSSRDEVSPTTILGICAVSVSATAQDERHPMNPKGVTFDDARVLPTWDWIAEPLFP